MTSTTATTRAVPAPAAPGLRQLIPLPYGHAARSQRDPLGFLLENAQRFGPVFRYQIGPWSFHLVSRPDGVRHVLQDHYRNYPRSWLYRRVKPVIGDGLVSTEGDVWRRQRRMVQPAFTHQRVAALAAPMTDLAARMLARWEAEYAGTGRSFDVAAEMVGLTLDIVGRTLLGVDLTDDSAALRQHVSDSLAWLEHRMSHLLYPPPSVPTPRNLRFRRTMKAFDGIVYRIINERRTAGAAGDDLLSLMLNVRDEESGCAGSGAGMTDLELRNQVMTFIGAGHETTAVALAWTWYLLARHPDVERRLRDEVATALAGRRPTFDDLPSLPYTKRVIEEVLRVYPPVYGVARDVVADDVIAGCRVPRGTTVVLSPYVTHHLPDVWPDPETFDPERFTPERSAGRPRFAWFPFLGGPHQCIGQDFAMMEATLIVAMVVQRFRLSLVPGADVKFKPLMSLRPATGVPMTAERA
jgi:cytochrome P450